METMETKQIQQVAPSTIQTSLPASLLAYSPSQLNSTYKGVTTVKQAIETKAPSFGSLVREGKATKKQIESLIMAHLVVLDACLKQKDGLTAEDIELIAEEVVERYPNLTFADVHVIFRDARLGKYGELYNRLSSAIVAKWFGSYFDQRCETYYQMRLDEDKRMYGSTSGKSDTEVLKALGYKIDGFGKVTLDKEKIEKNNAARKAEQERKAQERQQEIDKDNGYMRWRQEYLKNGTL